MAASINVGTLGLKLTADVAGFVAKMKAGQKAAAGMAAGMAALAAGGAAAAGISKMVAAASAFEQSIMDAAAVSREGAANFRAFEAAAMSASAGSMFSAKEAGDALKYLSMAGLSATEAMKALPSTLQLATAGSIDLGRAADISSDIMTAFGKKAEDLAHINDVLTKAFTSSNTNLEMLGDSMRYVAPVAGALDLQIEEITAALGMMANAGVKGSMGGTALRMSILRMVRPTKMAKKAIEELGLKTTDAQGQMRPLVDIIGQLERAAKGMTQADFAASIGKLVGAEALPGFLAIVNQGADVLKRFTEELENSGGTAEKVAKLMESTLSGQTKILKGNVENLAITYGNLFTPALKASNKYLLAQVQNLSTNEEAFNEVRDSVANFVDGMAGVVELFAGIGAVGLGVVNTLRKMTGGFELLARTVRLLSTRDMEDFNRQFDDLERRAREIENIAVIDSSKELLSLGTDLAESLRKGAVETRKLTKDTFDLQAALDKASRATKKADPFMKGPAGQQAKEAQSALEVIDDLLKVEGRRAQTADQIVHAMIKQRKEAEKMASKRVQETVDGTYDMLKGGMDEIDKGAKKRARRQQEEREAMESLASDALGVFSSSIMAFASAFDAQAANALAIPLETLSGAMSGIGDPMTMAAGAAKGLISAATQYVVEHEGFQARMKVINHQLSQMNTPDLLEEYLKSIEPSIAVLVSTMQALQPIAAMLGAFPAESFYIATKFWTQSVLDGAETLLSGAKMINVAIQGVYMGIIDVLEVMNVRGVMDSQIAAMEERLADARGVYMGLDNAANAVTDAQQQLADMTFESAQAAYDKMEQEAEAAENLRELNEELRNAPAGFKRVLSRLRYDAMNGQYSMDPRSQVARTRGQGQGTTIHNHAPIYLNLQRPEDFKEYLERESFKTTGSPVTRREARTPSLARMT